MSSFPASSSLASTPAPAAALADPGPRLQVLPFVIEPDASRGRTPAELIAWVRAEAGPLKELRLRHGALLFRGFGFQAAADFETLVASFGALDTYVGGISPRTQVEGKVYTSTDLAAHYEIHQHHECAYQPRMPAIVGFFCSVPAATGGQTPLTDSRRVTARLPEELRTRFERLGLIYVNNLPDGFGMGKSWQAQFGSEDRAQVEAILRAEGYEWSWRENGALRTLMRREALIAHPETGHRLWVNQADFWHPSGLRAEVRQRMGRVLAEDDFPMNVTYGDGSSIAEADLAIVRAAVQAEMTQFDWQKGDVIVCDNYLVSHGRRSYTGERKVLVALG